jgi:hypothetical protein
MRFSVERLFVLVFVERLSARIAGSAIGASP